MTGNPQNAAFERRIAILEAQRDYWRCKFEQLGAQNALEDCHLNDASIVDIRDAEAEVGFCDRALVEVEARLETLGVLP